MKVLVTGAAGFIGHALADRLCRRGDEVIGIDNLNDYYDVGLKQARLAQLEKFDNFQFHKLDLADSEALQELFAAQGFERVSQSGGAGRSALFTGKPGCLCQQQPGRFRQSAGMLPAAPYRTSGVCIIKLGVRR